MAETDPSQNSFESAMTRLEQIVEQMESDKLPLDEMLERYEEGTQLVKFCSEKLAAAEKRIEIISHNAAGKAQIGAFEPTAGPAAPNASSGSKPPKPKPSATDDDVSLF